MARAKAVSHNEIAEKKRRQKRPASTYPNQSTFQLCVCVLKWIFLSETFSFFLVK
jgi:hypothetical protein